MRNGGMILLRHQHCCNHAFPSTSALAIFTLVFQGAWKILAISADGINVALHAQVPPSEDMVVGSAITMAGVKQALLGRRGYSGGEINRGKDMHHLSDLRIAHAEIFYPFTYGGLHDRPWDLVIIEGWFKMINAFIHEVRAIAYPRMVTILFYCLDPAFPGLQHTSALDVDGFLTNSVFTQTFLLKYAPTALIPLAVDTQAFPFYPAAPQPDIVGRGENNRQGEGRIVYVGAAGAMKYKEMLAWMLREALPYGLDIYGSGWHDVPEFSACWRGVLPEKKLASVYGTALAVIGVTMDAQRSSGMINNRVFEALSVGAALISDYFPSLEAVFGDSILYVHQPGDVARHVERLLDEASRAHWEQKEPRERQRRRAIIEGGHSWAQRVEEMLAFAAQQTLPGRSLFFGSDGITEEANKRLMSQGCLAIAVILDLGLEGDVTFESTFVPALNLLTSTYRIDWWVAPPPDDEFSRDQGRESSNNYWQSKGGGASYEERRRQLQLPRDAGELHNYDVVWAAGRWGGPADRAVRAALGPGSRADPHLITRRLTAQLRGMVLWGELCIPNEDDSTKWQPSESFQRVEGTKCPAYDGIFGLRWYDVVFCQTDWDHAFLTRAGFDGAVSSNLQQAWGIRDYISRQENHAAERIASNEPTSYDVLVVGADDQIPEMLQALRDPGYDRVALAVVVSPGDAVVAARRGLSTIFDATAGVDISAWAIPAVDSPDLPPKISLNIVDPVDGSKLSSDPADVLLIGGIEGAGALAEMTSVATVIVVVATGQLRAWTTLITASSTGQQSWQGRLLLQNTDSSSNITGDARAMSLLEQRPEDWNLHFYARRLIAGMTRAFCLGLGSSRISLVRPVRGQITVIGISDTVTVEVMVEDFDVGRDGQWCITFNQKTVLCILRSSWMVKIRILSSSMEDGSEEDTRMGGNVHGTEGLSLAGKTKFLRVELSVELRSNMYQDVLFRGEPSWLLVDPSGSVTRGSGGCRYDEADHAVDCRRMEDRSSDESDSNHVHGSAQDPFWTSVDINDYLQTSSVVELNVV